MDGAFPGLVVPNIASYESYKLQQLTVLERYGQKMKYY